MLTLNNVQTGDEYSEALTLGPIPSTEKIIYLVANNAARVQVIPRGATVQAWSSEFLISPQSSEFQRVQGIRFRSAMAGQPASIIAQLIEPDDPLPVGSQPFGFTLAPGGNILSILALPFSLQSISALTGIPVGTTVVNFTPYGDFILGPNNVGSSSSATFDPVHNVADLAYYASSRKLLTRSAIFREVGDGVEIQMGRAHGTYPDGPLLGCNTGEGGTIYWTFFTTPVGGIPGTTPGGRFAGIPGSAAIVVRTQEPTMELGGGAIAQGGEMRLQTAPLGGGSAIDRLAVRAGGMVGIIGVSGDIGYLDAFNRGDLLVEGVLYAQSKTTLIKLRNPREDLQRTGRGIISEPFNPMTGANVMVLTSQTVHAASLGLRKGDVITNLIVVVTAAAVGAAPTLMKLGLYDKNGNLLAATGNVAGDAKWTSTGIKSFAVAAAFTVLADDIYYVAILQNGAFATTQPQITRGSSSVGGGAIGSGHISFGDGGTGQTDLPNPAAFGTTATLCPWIAVN